MPLVNLDVQLHTKTGDRTLTKIKIRHTKTVRELTHQYERVGVYYLKQVDVMRVVWTLLGIYKQFPDHYPALKAGDWKWDFEHPVEFQAMSYIDVTGWKMLVMVEDEDRYGSTVTIAFSGMAHIPMLTVSHIDCRFLKGDQLLILWDDFVKKHEPPPKPLSRWQRFKNWFRWNRKPSNQSNSSVLGDIGDAIGDILD